MSQGLLLREGSIVDAGILSAPTPTKNKARQRDPKIHQTKKGNRWFYLAVVMDLDARKPVGWAISLSPDSELTGKALTMAFEARGKPKAIQL